MEQDDALRAREFLMALPVSPRESTPTVEKLARWLEAALDAVADAEMKMEAAKREQADAYEVGRKHGLEQSQDIIDAEIEDLQKSDRNAEDALSRVWHEIACAAEFCSDEYIEPDQLDDAPPRRPHVTPPSAPPETPRRPKVRPDTARRSSTTQASGGKHQREVVIYLCKVGAATPQAVHDHLKGQGVSNTGAYNVLTRMLRSRVLERRDDGHIVIAQDSPPG